MATISHEVFHACVFAFLAMLIAPVMAALALYAAIGSPLLCLVWALDRFYIRYCQVAPHLSDDWTPRPPTKRPTAKAPPASSPSHPSTSSSKPTLCSVPSSPLVQEAAKALPAHHVTASVPEVLCVDLSGSDSSDGSCDGNTTRGTTTAAANHTCAHFCAPALTSPTAPTLVHSPTPAPRPTPAPAPASLSPSAPTSTSGPAPVDLSPPSMATAEAARTPCDPPTSYTPPIPSPVSAARLIQAIVDLNGAILSLTSAVLDVGASFLDTTSMVDVRALGIGGCGCVRACNMLLNGRLVRVAVKTMHTLRVTAVEAVYALQTEIVMHCRASAAGHPNIGRFLGAGQDLHSGIINSCVTEYVDGCSLHELFKEQKEQDQAEAEGTLTTEPGLRPLRFVDCLRMALEVAKGLLHLHTGPGIIHADIKDTNIMVPTGLDDQGRKIVTGVPVIIDFGLAQDMPADGSDNVYMAGAIGTKPFMAPETETHFIVSTASDVYQLGKLMHTMTLGASRRCASAPLVARCCARNPAARPTIEQVVDELQALFENERDEGMQYMADDYVPAWW